MSDTITIHLKKFQSFWSFVEFLNYKTYKDNLRCNLQFITLPYKTKLKFYKEFKEKREVLSKIYMKNYDKNETNTVQSDFHKLVGGDDSHDDYYAQVIASGKKTYDKIVKNPYGPDAHKIANTFYESFAYIFLSSSTC